MNKIILGSVIAVVLAVTANVSTVKAEEISNINSSNHKEQKENITVDHSLIPVSNDIHSYLVGVSKMEGTVVKIDKILDNSIIVVKDNSGQESTFYNRYESLNECLADLKLGDEILVKYALGTPLKVDGGNAFPLNKIQVLKKAIIEDRSWKEIKELNDVNEDKAWIIKLNKDFNKEDVNNNNIFIINQLGENIPVEFEILSDDNAIKVKPLSKYLNGETYGLFINRAFINVEDGTQGYKMNFTIKKL